MSPYVASIYVGMALEIHTAEMEEHTCTSPLNRYLNRPMVPYALQEIGVPDTGERALRTERHDDLSVEPSRPGESSLDTRTTEIEGKRPGAVQVNPI